MNIKLEKYNQFALCNEMYEVCDVIRNLNLKALDALILQIAENNFEKIMVVGEGSSRIFPGKFNTFLSRKNNSKFHLFNEGANQAASYKISNALIIGISNSGRTKEVINLFKEHQKSTNFLLAITASANSPLGILSKAELLLNCGVEQAVAATKSVIEQCLSLNYIVSKLSGFPSFDHQLLAKKFADVLDMEIPTEWITTLAKADLIYFVGKNDGVGEELTLKTNEITRKKSDFLEGTYCVHGIEEVMKPTEAVILIDPNEGEEDKFFEVLVKGVGLPVFAIASRQTKFQTLKIPKMKDEQYLQMAAGWNFLVEIGLHLEVNVDKTVRARKIGNEMSIDIDSLPKNPEDN